MFNNNDDAKVALTNGQVDALVVDLPTAFYITWPSSRTPRSSASCRPVPGTPEQFGIVLDKGSPLTACVSKAVDELALGGRRWHAGEAVARRQRPELT